MAHRKYKPHGGRRLTPEQVAIIRASRESSNTLGRRYGITSTAIWHARVGYTYKDLPFPTQSPSAPSPPDSHRPAPPAEPSPSAPQTSSPPPPTEPLQRATPPGFPSNPVE